MFIALAADRPNFERRYSNPLLATLSTDASVSFEQMATSSGRDALEQLKLGCAAKTKSPQKQIDRIAATKQPLDSLSFLISLCPSTSYELTHPPPTVSTPVYSIPRSRDNPKILG